MTSLVLYTYWVLFAGLKVSLYSFSSFNSEYFTTADIYFILYSNLSENIPNTEFIAQQDIENIENFTYQTISNMNLNLALYYK